MRPRTAIPPTRLRQIIRTNASQRHATSPPERCPTGKPHPHPGHPSLSRPSDPCLANDPSQEAPLRRGEYLPKEKVRKRGVGAAGRGGGRRAGGGCLSLRLSRGVQPPLPDTVFFRQGDGPLRAARTEPSCNASCRSYRRYPLFSEGLRCEAGEALRSGFASRR